MFDIASFIAELHLDEERVRNMYFQTGIEFHQKQQVRSQSSLDSPLLRIEN